MKHWLWASFSLVLLSACTPQSSDAPLPPLTELELNCYSFSIGLGPPSCGGSDIRPWPRPVPSISKIEPAEARRGETVIIYGSNLSLASVHFGSLTYADKLSNPDTEIIVKVPQDAETGPIRVSTPNAVTFSEASFTVLRPVIYVSQEATPKGDGKSWETAFNSLQDALSISVENDQIWIATGTYRPAGANGNRDASFRLKRQVDIYGGFRGTESRLDERDSMRNLVSLSGDLNGNDTGSLNVLDPSRADNVEHVVIGRESAILDGVTIRDGNGLEEDSLDPNHIPSGAGMLLESASITLNDVVFSHNAHIRAGGALSILKNGYGRLSNLRFINNSARQGGAVFSQTGVFLKKGMFEKNQAAESGGAIFIDSGTLELTEVSYLDNQPNDTNSLVKH